MTQSTIRRTIDDDAIVTLTIDDPEQRVNTMNERFVSSLSGALDEIGDAQDIAGVIIASGKSTFFAGGDLNDLVHADRSHIDDFTAFVERNRDLLRRLERLGVPVVATINGTALGGGLELTLATHHRIAVKSGGVRLGLPEVTLGLLPGAGGVVRSVRLLGVQKALASLLLTGRQVDATAALELGIVDELVDSPADLASAAKAWILANPDARQPWDMPGYAIPGGAPGDPAQPLHASLPLLTATLRADLKGANYPAPRNILKAAVEGAQVDFDNALRIETRYFVDLAVGQIAKNMIQARFFDTQTVNGLRGRDASRTPWKATKAVVLGAGMMGAGIAYQCAAAGIDVVLKDVSAEAAERGKDYSRKVLDKKVGSGALSEAQRGVILDRITATADVADAAGADLVIEAVFEDPDLKARVLKEVEPVLAPGALIGSNTSTLPITGLAGAVQNPADFIGLHFFSPVDKMPLLEIIKGGSTSAESVSRALDVARQIAKTPIVVNDSRGFFTSRVIGTFVNEALAMLGEGVPAPMIEQATTQAGYPAPALQLADELNLELLRRVRDASRDAAEAEGRDWVAHPAEAVLDRMLTEFDRAGRLAGAGFYEYSEGRRSGLWSGLGAAFPAAEQVPTLTDLKERLLFVEAVESARCLDEGVLESVADANIGSLLGIGYPGWTGGVLQFIDGYEGGVAGFVARANELAARYGTRFLPPASLTRLAADGRSLADSRRQAEAVS
ncbi:3-hydroxyacyl-CoA dehydrogenase NAD-binding domain-containing protein [Gordonia McavH-238-E]|uniref:3-hydroxyacyl-CoA dehydrogenase NAD-binding domain-containing protein n=1 Tax=Gordonia sp. McavH-238-E TaxID=2917736 RepID=UPI001EF57B50|nr:3-hydroxyacyl-CoA dehydrogenase NAD-binding domain-containing protein [Gordonia sp. McavH-238-E]MCG7631296.1 3-hydroxyacyl-CoA dehydrogenase NAD-binding domain-containing protein [Gordonia sp. McavH-238-E]